MTSLSRIGDVASCLVRLDIIFPVRTSVRGTVGHIRGAIRTGGLGQFLGGLGDDATALARSQIGQPGGRLAWRRGAAPAARPPHGRLRTISRGGRLPVCAAEIYGLFLHYPRTSTYPPGLARALFFWSPTTAELVWFSSVRYQVRTGNCFAFWRYRRRSVFGSLRHHLADQ